MRPAPHHPLIHIISGKCNNNDISNSTATLTDIGDPEFGYRLLDGPFAGYSVVSGVAGDEISAWKECVAVPIGELVALRAAFMGVEPTNFQHAVIQKLFIHTPRR